MCVRLNTIPQGDGETERQTELVKQYRALCMLTSWFRSGSPTAHWSYDPNPNTNPNPNPNPTLTLTLP